jgi:hypothetical protein
VTKAADDKRVKKLRSLLFQAVHEGWPVEQLDSELVKLYRAPRAAKKTG